MSFAGTHAVVTIGSWVYKLVGTTCGKPNCSRCPHGPYWYVWMKLRNGRVIKKYVGKEAPPEVYAAMMKQRNADKALEPKAGKA